MEWSENHQQQKTNFSPLVPAGQFFTLLGCPDSGE